MNGTPVNAPVELTQLVPVTVVPHVTVFCGGCGYMMKVDEYVKGSGGGTFLCATRGCEHKGKLIYIPYERVSMAITGYRDI